MTQCVPHIVVASIRSAGSQASSIGGISDSRAHQPARQADTNTDRQQDKQTGKQVCRPEIYTYTHWTVLPELMLQLVTNMTYVHANMTPVKQSTQQEQHDKSPSCQLPVVDFCLDSKGCVNSPNSQSCHCILTLLTVPA